MGSFRYNMGSFRDIMGSFMKKKRTKLYECDYCDYTTIRKNNLSRHLETKHNTWNIDFEAIKNILRIQKKVMNVLSAKRYASLMKRQQITFNKSHVEKKISARFVISSSL